MKNTKANKHESIRMLIYNVLKEEVLNDSGNQKERKTVSLICMWIKK